MSITCTAAGILCLLYFTILFLYSGFTSAFYLIWPFMAIGFFTLGQLFRIHFFQCLPPVLRGGLLIIIGICLLFFLGVEAMILKYAMQSPKPGQEYVIVLGAHVRTSGPSRALALRLDKALEYALDNPDTVFIVSGGQGANEPCTEALAMKEYLLKNGMPAEKILLEEASTNTRENLAFSKAMLPNEASVGIISNGFHMCRALHLAKSLGIENASGIPARSDLPTQPTNLLREFFAVVKDFWLCPQKN